MARPRPIIFVVLALLLAAGGCAKSAETPPVESSWAPSPDTAAGLSRVARTEGESLLLQTADGDRPFVAGVNIGATTPGHSPGELAVSAEDYRRWFGEISALGLRSVRVYTILPPAFYTELEAYNTAHPSEPLYLLQGVWIPEERFYETQDLYDSDVYQGFKDEITDAVKAVHGELTRPKTPGHASGTWTADVSPCSAQIVRTSASSAMSPMTNGESRTAASKPVSRLSSTTTSRPSWRRRRTVCEPM